MKVYSLKILLDESLPEQLAKELGDHEAITVSQMENYFPCTKISGC